MDFIKRLIKLAMEYQDTLADEPPETDERPASTESEISIEQNVENVENEISLPERTETEEPGTIAENPVKETPSQEVATTAQSDPIAEKTPEPEPIEPAMFQNCRQARLERECITDTFLTLPPRRPSFFDK